MAEIEDSRGTVVQGCHRGGQEPLAHVTTVKAPQGWKVWPISLLDASQSLVSDLVPGRGLRYV